MTRKSQACSVMGVMIGGTFGALARKGSHPPTSIFIVRFASASCREGLYISMQIPFVHIYMLDGTQFLCCNSCRKILVVLGVSFVCGVGGECAELGWKGPPAPQGLAHIGDSGGWLQELGPLHGPQRPLRGPHRTLWGPGTLGPCGGPASRPYWAPSCRASCIAPLQGPSCRGRAGAHMWCP